MADHVIVRAVLRRDPQRSPRQERGTGGTGWGRLLPARTGTSQGDISGWSTDFEKAVPTSHSSVHLFSG